MYETQISTWPVGFAFWAGFVGIAQDITTLALCLEIGRFITMQP